MSLVVAETAYSSGKFKHDPATLRQIWILCSLYKQERLGFFCVASPTLDPTPRPLLPQQA